MTELSEEPDRVLTAADARLALGEQLEAMLEHWCPSVPKQAAQPSSPHPVTALTMPAHATSNEGESKPEDTALNTADFAPTWLLRFAAATQHAGDAESQSNEQLNGI